jgi:transcriptional regulator with XRE-family HTH domain
MRQPSWSPLDDQADSSPPAEKGIMPLEINDLGRLIAAKRGGRGIRAAALDACVSPATLSRVENGHMPDLETFAKICRWLDKDPREFLGFEPSPQDAPTASVHFRKKKTVSKETATALGALILAAQRAMIARDSLNE